MFDNNRKNKRCLKCKGTGKGLIHGTNCVKCNGTGKVSNRLHIDPNSPKRRIKTKKRRRLTKKLVVTDEI